MTRNEFNHRLKSLNNLSPQQIRQLQSALDSKLIAPTDTGEPVLSDEQAAEQELQRRLVEAGVLSEIKPPITDMTPYRNRTAVPIQGESLSETVIRERR